MENNSKKRNDEEMEKDFKNKIFNALAQKNPGVHIDEDGFIVVPVRVRRKPKKLELSPQSP